MRTKSTRCEVSLPPDKGGRGGYGFRSDSALAESVNPPSPPLRPSSGQAYQGGVSAAFDVDISRAVRLLRAGELVGIPTETVYGLAADAANPAAVAKIFAAKGRPADHPLIVHIADGAQLPLWAKDIPDAAYQLADAFWPGPLTLILKRQPTVPDAVTGGQDTVGLRVPNHPLTLELLRMFTAAGGSGGVAAPSANRFGRISPTTADHVREELGDAVPLVLDGGPCAVGIESTIVDLSRGTPVILRPGAITAADIERVLHTDTVRPEPVEGREASPRVSGSLDAHYAPTTPLRLVASADLQRAVEDELAAGRRCAVLSFQAIAPRHGLQHYPASHDPAGYAHDLYAALRNLDQSGAQVILVEDLPQGPHWLAVKDRLTRAACGSGVA
ncbi:MAG: threonylcarbamoyl-AMP synthase [Rhodocyclaceae bacterium]|nr:MAG: threonylcarbamoyl-AMP synthase [Rhodocyclaceae bacterium]